MAPRDLTTFICLFHSAERAEAAIAALEGEGFHRNSITSVWKDSSESDAASLRQELAEIGAPERDLSHLTEGVTQGGVVLSLEALEEQSDAIEGIFHRYSADKIDETDVQRTRPFPVAPPVTSIPQREAGPTSVDSVVVPVAEDQLLIDKREVDRGGVRVYRRTVEAPVSEAVSLREEHVIVERRPVDRGVNAADLSAANQVIELKETEEIPVVTKSARVVEEIRVGVVGSEHTETVQDTLRHVEVEVETIPEPGHPTRSDPR